MAATPDHTSNSSGDVIIISDQEQSIEQVTDKEVIIINEWSSRKDTSDSDIIILGNDNDIKITRIDNGAFDNDHFLGRKLHLDLNSDINKDRSLAKRIQEQELMLMNWQDPPLFIVDKISTKSKRISKCVNNSETLDKRKIDDQLIFNGVSYTSTSSFDTHFTNRQPSCQQTPTTVNTTPLPSSECTFNVKSSAFTGTVRPNSLNTHPTSVVASFPSTNTIPKITNVAKNAVPTKAKLHSSGMSSQIHVPLSQPQLSLGHLITKNLAKKRSKGSNKTSKRPCLENELDSSLSISIKNSDEESLCIQFMCSPSTPFISIDCPPWWLSSTGNLVDVNIQCQEANIVSSPLKHSGFSITKVERIQSLHLWKRYIGEVKLLVQSRGEVFQLNEEILYHCSRADKLTICNEGLDTRLCIGGNFGRGIYFSDKPVKCDHYSNGNKLMYACKVILGDIKEYGRGRGDGSLTREPAKTGGGYYDSVKGFLSVGEEYVIYNNYRCIPLYIITYGR